MIVMKSGRHASGSQAAVSHTGALVGSDDVFDAALNRAGVVRVYNYSNFFAVAETLHTGLRTPGPRLAVVTNGGGPGVLAADAAALHVFQALDEGQLAGVDAFLIEDETGRIR